MSPVDMLGPLGWWWWWMWWWWRPAAAAAASCRPNMSPVGAAPLLPCWWYNLDQQTGPAPVPEMSSSLEPLLEHTDERKQHAAATDECFPGKAAGDGVTSWRLCEREERVRESAVRSRSETDVGWRCC